MINLVSHLQKKKLRRLSNKLGMDVRAAFLTPYGKVLFTEHGKIHQFKNGGLTTVQPYPTETLL
jgi:hypothetical protein